MISAANMGWGWLPNGGGSGSGPASVALSAITAATAVNTIDNAGYTQTWGWSALSATSPGLAITGVLSSGSTSINKNLVSVEMSGAGASFGSANALYIKNSASVGGMTGGLSGLWVDMTANNAASATYIRGIVINASSSTVTTLASAGLLIDVNTSVTGTGAFGLYVRRTGPVSGNTARFDTNGTGLTANTITTVISNTASTTASNTAMSITVSGGTTGNYAIVASGGSSFRLSGASTFNPSAIIHIGAGNGTTIPSLIVNAATLMGTPVAQAIEATTAHLYWTDSGGTRYQLDQQSAAGNLYTTDGTFTGTRVADLDNFSITWDNVGLFRVAYTSGSDTGTFDFNQGIDFAAADASFSTSFTMNPTSYISFGVTNLSTMDTVAFSIQNDGIYVTVEQLTAQDFLIGVIDSTGRIGKIQIDPSLTLSNGILSVT